MPGNRDRTNVILEVGVALGLGKPMVLVARRDRLPHGLVGIPMVGLESIWRLPEVIEIAWNAERHEVPLDRWHYDARKPRGVRMPALQGSDSLRQEPSHRRSRYHHLSDEALASELASAFSAAGSRVLVSDPSEPSKSSTVPDIVVWDDRLMSLFGLPLPVEIVRRSPSTKAEKDHLQRTLHASSAQSLLAVVAGNGEATTWTDGYKLILTVGAEQLLDELASASLPEALAGLLQGAT